MDKIKYECKWNPKEDITVFELAQCIPFMFSKLHEMDEWDKIDQSITRHFDVTEFDYGKMINQAAESLKGLI